MAKIKRDYVVLIPTHGRPDRVYTHRALRRLGYTGRIVLVVDNEDETIDEYRDEFGSQVYVFDKAAAAAVTDDGDNFPERRGVIYARNACFDIAQELGYTYFIVLDDDYRRFMFKRDRDGNYVDRTIWNLDEVFRIMFDYYKAIPALSIAMAQTGDFVGGEDCVGKAAHIWMRPGRKVMNSFFCSTERPFRFFGRINEDVNTYVCTGGRGGLFLTSGAVALQQHQTQTNAGGMTELYLDHGTYVKSFYSVIYAPSAAKIAVLNSTHPRIHHLIQWRNAVPCILSEAHRKASVRLSIVKPESNEPASCQ